LRGDLLRGSGHHDLRRLCLRGHLGSRKTGWAADAADHDYDIVALGQSLGDIDSFLGLTGVVSVDRLDFLAANSAGGILLADGKVDGLPL